MVYICPWRFVLIFANSADPDEMHHYAEFHLGLHCLKKYPLSGFQYTEGSIYNAQLFICRYSSTLYNTCLWLEVKYSIHVPCQPPFDPTFRAVYESTLETY